MNALTDPIVIDELYAASAAGVLLAAVALAWVLGVTAAPAKEIFKVATLAPQGSIWDTTLREMGAAWSKDQTLYGARPANYDVNKQRYPLRSYGYGFRVNLFNIAILRIDKSYPLDAASKKGYWFWTLGSSF